MTPESKPLEVLFEEACAAKLRQSTGRMVICLEKLSAEQIWARGAEHENAPGNLVLHLCGNMRQWVISGLGGKPDVRERDKEFETTGGMNLTELLMLLAGTVEEALQVIFGLTAEQLSRLYTIQGRTVTGFEAVITVVEHFGQHSGQIVYAAKQMLGRDLDLTIPRRR